MLVSSFSLLVLLFFAPSSLSLDMNRFSTKSAYNFKPFLLEKYPHFELFKVWALLRHGTRLPSKKIIAKYNGLVDIKNEIVKNSKSLSDQQKTAFLEWKPMEIDPTHQKFLTKQGEAEHFKLGFRFRQRFPSFFDSNSSFVFKHTPTQRTEVSAKKFIEGMFPDTNITHTLQQVARDDPVLRPYKGCPLWRQEVKKNKAVSLKERRKFEESEQIENLVNELREFTQVKHLTIFDIELIYTMCAFENSWEYSLFQGQSIWCSLFKNERHLRAIEFLEDLKYYWIDGPGFEITRNVACKTVEDILNLFTRPVEEKQLSFYFTHSGTVLKLLTFMGLHQDPYDLTIDNFHDDRKFKTSNIDTFSSNIYVILYK